LSVLRGARAATIIISIATIVGSCNMVSTDAERARSNDVFDKVRAIDLQPRFPQQTGPATIGREDGVRPQTYPGTPAPTVIGAAPATNGEGFELNFENTPVTSVAKVILGDILGVGYTIDPRVQGTVSLASGRPVPKGDLLYVLESALRMSNVVMVREGRNYRLIPGTDAIGTGTVDAARRPEAGYGLTVVPLQFVSAPTIMRLLDSFAVKPGTVRADPARNMLIVQGTAAERRTAIDAIASFDADWMRGQSVGIYPVRNSAPEAVIS
jgi:general secretion pathway protein D